MALTQTCDGCGSACGSPHKRGWIRPRDYCDECVQLADLYTGALNAAHSRCAALFDELERTARADCPLREVPL